MHRNMNGDTLTFLHRALLMSERKKIDRLAAVPIRIGLLFLDLTQIFDDCLYARLDDRFGIARKVFKRL